MSKTVPTQCDDLESCPLWRLLDVTRQLSLPIDLNEILQQVIEAARDVLEAERGTVFLYDAGTDELYSRVATGEDEIRFPASRGIAGETTLKRKTVNVPDCYNDPRFNQDIDRQTGYRTRCMLSIPLVGIDQKLVGVLQVLNKRDGVFDEDDAYLAETLAAQCAVALQRAMLIDEYLVKQKLEQDLALARDIQMRVIPTELPQKPGYDLAGWSNPADQTGGDIYDVLPLSDGDLAILLGDATGHGVGPALSVTQVRAMFRMGIRLGAQLDDLFAQINEQLTEDLPGNRFVTGFVGILHTSEHRLSYHSGGQGPLMHYHREPNEVEWLDASACPMGIMPGLKLSAPSPMELMPGDILGLISDGIFEYENTSGDQFGTDRVTRFILENKQMSAQRLIESLCEAVYEFSEGHPQDDDMTIVIVKRQLS